jgi:hypothetical protein
MFLCSMMWWWWYLHWWWKGNSKNNFIWSSPTFVTPQLLWSVKLLLLLKWPRHLLSLEWILLKQWAVTRIFATSRCKSGWWGSTKWSLKLVDSLISFWNGNKYMSMKTNKLQVLLHSSHLQCESRNSFIVMKLSWPALPYSVQVSSLKIYADRDNDQNEDDREHLIEYEKSHLASSLQCVKLSLTRTAIS